MPETSSNSIRRIVVGADGSPSSNAAMRWALSQAELTGDTVQVVIAWEYPNAVGGYGWAPVTTESAADLVSIAEKVLAEAISEVVPADSAVKIEREVVEGYAPSVLTDASAQADLLVVGSRGHGTFTSALLGSVSQHCAHHAKCPVVIIRGQGS